MSTDTPRVLFLSPRREEYLADSVFHGLRSLLGDRAVDYPKHEIMYRSCPEESIRRARGHGFTLYGLLEDIEIDRSRTLDEIHWGEFDLVIFGAIHESFGQFVEIYPELERHDTRGAVLDGADGPAMYPVRAAVVAAPAVVDAAACPHAASVLQARVSARDLPEPLLSAYCRANVGRADCRSFVGSDRSRTRFRPRRSSPQPPEKSQMFATHIVDDEVARQVDGARVEPIRSRAKRSTSPTSSAPVSRSRPSAPGWDCLRHYEIAANGAVPCFRDLDAKPSSCAPHGLNETNCIVYSSYEDLRSQIDRMTDERVRNASAWSDRLGPTELHGRAREAAAVSGRPAAVCPQRIKRDATTSADASVLTADPAPRGPERSVARARRPSCRT